MVNIDIDALAGESIEQVKYAMDRLATLKGWNINSAKGLVSCAVVIVKHAEAVGKVKELTGSEKQAFAVAIIKKLVGPKLPWWIPFSVIQPFLEGAINAIVEALKDHF